MVGLLTQRKQKQKGEQERLLPITTGQQIAATLLQEQNQKHSLPIITGPVFNANNAVADAVICCLLLFCLFWSGLHVRVGYETKDMEKRRNGLNLHLSKSLHCILDSCIIDQLSFGVIIFIKFHPMG